ncbi:MAG TPA: helix-turn-helix domain-containing protein [Polyangiaceae bacterium]|jgi:transcriptional regulator with XRE-family HTH domain|nr:helix-turn-helix domain-containing protein [Polyangiaceae bacterium]
MDFDDLARQTMRALRGARSQTAFSRRLGYSTNVAYAWESGRRAPTAAEVLSVAGKLGLDVPRAVEQFFRRLPETLRGVDPKSPGFVAALLSAMKGPGPMEAIAARVGLSRSAVSRILSGRSEPRLPVFLALVDALSRRVLDLLSGLVDVSLLPAARDEWERLEALRRLAVDNPLSEAVPRFIELDQYARLPRHKPGWIAKRLGVPLADEERTLRDLEKAGVLSFDGIRYKLDRTRSVDTTRDPRAASHLRKYWTERAAERIRAGGDGQFSYLVFDTDDATLAAIEELRSRFFREMRALVRGSKTSRRVAVANVQLFAIDVG